MDPFGPLTFADFPLTWIGSCVYRRTNSSPIFTAPNEAVAADLVMRLNRDHLGGLAPAVSWREQEAAYGSSAAPPGTLVFGPR